LFESVTKFICFGSKAQKHIPIRPLTWSHLLTCPQIVFIEFLCFLCIRVLSVLLVWDFRIRQVCFFSSL
jgi:hypothetical protein